MKWIVKILLNGETWYDLCECESVQSAAAIVEALLGRGTGPLMELRIVRVPVMPS